ncbi:hypothetical protein PV328_006761 [Microctonus aethiopoides]|uniref:Uncharacterized protein n=1 Tax=Microctonus aethiopoides TaxID=144406 RepID=A0AA39KTQ2_9HYME|nr:hypothetical protein PV328_006761 [Microctonus aethiopoides]
MGNLATVVRFGAALLPYLVDYVQANNETVSECIESNTGCLRCRGTSCARCAVLLHRGDCVDTCPPGHIADWSTRDEYMGRICRDTGYMFALSGSQVAILVGVISGATICIFIILCGAIVVYRRKKKAVKLIRQYEDSAERREFLKHLATLRGEANTFLAMLNDTRRQVRELYYSGNNGDGAVGVQAYRPVLRDLARILVLVNRKDEEIYLPPDDWQRLLAWAERLLRRYKKHTLPEVAQLVTFLQQPVPINQQISSPISTPQQIAITQSSSQTYEMRSTPSNLTTFQANAPLTTFQASDKSSISPASSSLGYTKDSPIGSSLGQNSSIAYNEKLSSSGSTVGQTTPLVYNSHQKRHHQSPHLQELAISAFNHNYNLTSGNMGDSSVSCNGSDCNGLSRELNPQWEFQSPIEATNYTILSDWAPGRDYLIDDFTILGFRPQDEITTEL